MIVIGIDPGTRYTGWGVVRKRGNKIERLGSGRVIAGKSADPMEERLAKIWDGLGEIFRRFSPEACALEGIFTARNAMSSLKLGHARGVCMLAVRAHDARLAEYSPASVKQAVTGNGRADKGSVERMVRLILAYNEKMSEDESDALAVAICHCHSAGFAARLSG